MRSTYGSTASRPETLSFLAALILVAAALGIAPLAAAEGSSSLVHSLDLGTLLFADVIDEVTETVVWTGTGSVTVRDPSDQLVGIFASGAVVTPTVPGAYSFELSADQTTGWDLTVFAGATPQFGRVFAFEWQLDSGAFDGASSTDYSLYAMVPSGAPGHEAVFQASLTGITGFKYQVQASRTGVSGPKAGTSVPISGTVHIGEVPLYLDPPEVASYSQVSPTAIGVEVAPGVAGGYDFDFDVDVDGTYHLVVDADLDGEFDIAGDGDVVISGLAAAGSNQVFWDGTDRFGVQLPAGGYEVRLIVSVGEVHVVVNDAETVYEGLRIMQVESDLSRSSAEMYWNDSEVQANAILMPNGQFGVENSGPTGISSQTLAELTVANANAHSWGNFILTGKGNDARMDTFVWVTSASCAPLPITHSAGCPPLSIPNGTDCPATANGASCPGIVCDSGFTLSGPPPTCGVGVWGGIPSCDPGPLVDSDGDGLPDVDEIGVYGTDPGNPDSDGDGLDDGVEVLTAGSNPMSADSDNDGVPDSSDNCLRTYNPTQADTGGLGSGVADGAGDACQNGDRNGDGTFDVLDVVLERRALAGLETLPPAIPPAP